jgi:oxygen-independent coproporphyrinogen-3 oxidase
MKQRMNTGSTEDTGKSHRGTAWENGGMGAGIYISIPFCKAKCSFCNFASGVFGAERMEGYVDRVCEEIRGARGACEGLGITVPDGVDSVYFGGGTPSLLEPGMVAQVFAALGGEFQVDRGAEITVEGAPGQFGDAALEAFLRGGMNRVSLGVQSFVDRESAAVGRLHTGAECLAEIRRLERAGVTRLGVDLICGLPHQTEASWRESVEASTGSGVEHVSVYMLEVDEDSRLGRESLAGGTRYGAGELPSEDVVADWYGLGCEGLARGGIGQYEISNYARVGGASRHNRKYWERESYLGFGLDAHSMVRDGAGGVRWGNTEDMSEYVGPGIGERGFRRTVDRVSREMGFEEALFLGLRLVEGVDLGVLRGEFGELVDVVSEGLEEVLEAGLMERDGPRVRLTAAGRMASNEVFGRLLVGDGVGV